MKLRRFATLAFLIVAFVGCSDDDTTEPAPLPDGVPSDLQEGWNEFLPGGETSCAIGGEYAFWVRPGTVNNVVIEFIGGGACWDAFTCGVASASDAICTQSVDGTRQYVAVGEPHGIHDHTDAENPFKDWFHVVVPYCSCDVHWGNNVATYDSQQGQITVQHKGQVNTAAVLDWVYDNFDGPEQILVTGCSAGSYGSIMWSAHVAEHYPDSRVLQFGDSGAGVITQNFFQDSFPSWKAEGSFPAWIDGLDPSQVDVLDMALADLYVEIANHYADQQFSQYNTAFDDNQTFYFTAMGGSGAEEWSQLMHASIAEINERAPTFSSFIAPGEQHCIVLFDNFYTVNVDGRRLVDWLAEMVAGDKVEDVACEGEACKAATP